MKDCIFCSIASNRISSHCFWQDDSHMAFLSIYPNTSGFTVVIPKKHYPSYAFSLPDTELSNLIIASKKVALIIDSKFETVGRTGLILEGFGVDHVHSKLMPMHGTKHVSENWQPILSTNKKYFETYEGFLSSNDSYRADENELSKLAAFLRDQ